MKIFCCKKKVPRALPEPSELGVEEALKVYYRAKVLPAELAHAFDQFHGPGITDAEFAMRPTVMCVGQYSVGKTTLINHLIECDYPGARIGPEPTTDRFVVCVGGEDVRETPGTSLVQDDTFAFQSLSMFGAQFLSKLTCASVPSRLLEHISFIDTPGVLTGDKQRANRGYDFDEVVRFLADKVDRILLLFDTSKLDISDEFKNVILAMRGNEEKVKIILNKADAVSSSELIRVRGALMFNLGKVLNTPEVPRVYIGSFHSGPLKNPELAHAFAEDANELLADLNSLPKTVKIRKINDVAKRAKVLRAHILVMDALMRRSRTSTTARVVRATTAATMLACYAKLQRTHRIADADMPSIEHFVAKARASDPSKWRRLDRKTFAALNEFIDKDISRIMRALPHDNEIDLANITPDDATPPASATSPPPSSTKPAKQQRTIKAENEYKSNEDDEEQ